METYITGTGQRLRVHSKEKCVGRWCVIHNPSKHHMRDWTTNWREDKGIMERICKHGVGHPDPDDLSYQILENGQEASTIGIHGCDGCCVPPVPKN